eukprot:Gb_05507 [translate_table: standard]
MARGTRLLLYLLFGIAVSVFAQQEGNHSISLGSTLQTSNNYKCVSTSGEFAFGFYSVDQRLYLLGIWFDKTPDKTLVWAANRDNPVDEGSSLELTKAGELILRDSHGRNKWSTGKITSGAVVMASMLDSGNFVLLNASSQFLWQSFDSPTDTLLPGQILKWKSILYSKASEKNYSTGRFMLNMQQDGNLVLYPVERRAEGQGSYWSTATFKSGVILNPMNLIFNQSGLLYLVNETNTIVKTLNKGPAGPGENFVRVTLDSDGILREYARETDENSSWSVIWKPISDPCKEVKSQCGISGICNLNGEQKPDCRCPPGFDLIDGQDPFKGCLRNSSESCSETSNKMVEADNTDWADGSDYSLLTPLNESECKQACMSDCLCIVVTYGDEICHKKKNPLIDGRRGIDITRKAFIKVSLDKSTKKDGPADGIRRPPRPRDKKLFRSGIGLLGISLVILVGTTLAAFWVYRSRLNNISSYRLLDSKIGGGLNSFTYKEIDSTTNGFKEQLGTGAFGKVYKGRLSDGRDIAVKKLDKVLQEGEKEFRTEMAIIGTTHHKNLVQLIGFCDESSHRLLVYEYLSNGSLDTLLFDQKVFLGWNLRVQIALGVARGIAYLHEECRTQIIHCDIKPQNILLDDDYNAKISDFGLAKLLGKDQTRTFTTARGTRGYLSPEWQRNLPISVKVDVYSFGMMLLEIICCRKNVCLEAEEKEIILSDWAYQCLKFGRLRDLVKRQLSEDNGIEERELERMVLVALWCIQEDPFLRLSMRKVVQMLEGAIDISVPPPIPSFTRSLYG